MRAIVSFSQRDPGWATELLGSGRLTIGQAGCLLTAAASMLASWGVDTDPLRLNARLTAAGGFIDENLLVFGALESVGGCQFLEYVACARESAPVERLRAAIGAGAGVLAQVDWQPGGAVQPHWVWMVSLGSRSGMIVDPWQPPGEELVDLARYLAPGWDAGRGIFAAAVYRQVAGGAMRTARQQGVSEYVQWNGHAQ